MYLKFQPFLSAATNSDEEFQPKPRVSFIDCIKGSDLFVADLVDSNVTEFNLNPQYDTNCTECPTM